MREDYRHFGARSTAKIGPAKRHHTADHHAIAKTDLRAGIVKARRPRVRAGGAKRRALHDAEHRSSIEGVMVDASDEVQLIALTRAHKRATFVFAADVGSVAQSRTERVRLCDQDFPHERDRIVRKIRAPFRARMCT
jgi:hypothetical protein